MKRTNLILLGVGASALAPALAWARVAPPAPPVLPGGAVPPSGNSAIGNTGGPAETEAQFTARMRGIAARLRPQRGDVRIPGAEAVLHLGQNYYFLPPDEAKLVLTEAWGNPPSAVSGVLGMVLPQGKSFDDPDTWGAVITWEPSGYVSDDDAGSADYAAILQQIQAAEPAINARRRSEGYPAQHLVGWAQQPAYDSASHSVVWARDYSYEGETDHGLNYDIRLLGRRGVLSLNMLTTMPKLAETRDAARAFAASAEFQPGARYADYDSSSDRTAAYGVGGLVAAGVGVSVASKLGLWAGILLFLKKGAIIIIAAVAALWAAIRRLFGGRRREEADIYEGARPDDTPPP